MDNVNNPISVNHSHDKRVRKELSLDKVYVSIRGVLAPKWAKYRVDTSKLKDFNNWFTTIMIYESRIGLNFAIIDEIVLDAQTWFKADVNINIAIKPLLTRYGILHVPENDISQIADALIRAAYISGVIIPLY